MDKETDKREEIVSTTNDDFWLKLLGVVDEKFQETQKLTDDKLKSRWLWGNDRASLMIDKALHGMIWRTTRINISILAQLDNIEKRLIDVEQNFQKIAKKTDLKLEITEKKVRDMKTEWQPIIDDLKEAFERTSAYFEHHR